MGTRGAVGFRANKQDKVTYNHFDSYPSGLGSDVISFIRSHSFEDIQKAAQNIQMVDTSIEPTPQQIKDCAPWTDLSVSNQSTSDWYCLLRSAQGDLGAYVQGLKYMNDSKGFLLNSLFCEYAYIINVDTKQLEFYTGFNKKARKTKGRYADKQPEDSRPDSYYGVALLWKIDLNDILSASDEEVSAMIKKMDKKSEGFYNRQERAMKKEAQVA